MVNILFLDIDGVLWTASGVIYWRETCGEEREPKREVDPVRLALLQCLCKEVPNLKIVISSSWRHGTSINGFKEIFGPIIGERIIGITPTLRDEQRGAEIASWFHIIRRKNPEFYKSINAWAIVDDDSDMWPMVRGFFKTDSYEGMSYRTMEQLKKYYLGTKKYRDKINIGKIFEWVYNNAFYYTIKKPFRYKIYWPIRTKLKKWWTK